MNLNSKSSHDKSNKKNLPVLTEPSKKNTSNLGRGSEV